jgi:hypothetical protein
LPNIHLNYYHGVSKFIQSSKYKETTNTRKRNKQQSQNTVELGYNVVKGTEYIVSLQGSAVITEQYNVMVDSEELIGITEYLTL